jgi:hypothetical protein
MICFAKPVLIENLCISQKEEFLITLYTNICAVRIFDERPSILIRDKLIFLPERMLHKDYYRKSSVKKILWSWVSRASAQDEVIGGNPRHKLTLI